MSNRLQGKRVAIFVEDLFEDSELLDPMHFLRAEGAEVVLVGPDTGREYRGKQGAQIEANRKAADVSVADFDAYIVPGGYAPGKMRNCRAMIDLLTKADHAGKIVAAICHGPQMLISAEILRGRMATSVSNVAIDVKNAGASFFDEPVVVDGNLITSRTPADLPDFLEAISDQLFSNDPSVRQPLVAGA